jgi:hypothetical protein
MAHSKRRVYQHIMEDKSISLLRSRLPEEWLSIFPMQSILNSLSLIFIIFNNFYIGVKQMS